MQQTLQTAIEIVGSGAVSILGVVAYVKKHFPKQVAAIEKDIPAEVKTIGGDVIHVLEDLAKTPWFAGVAAKGKIETHHIVSELEKSTVAKVAAQVLQAFGTGYANLTANEKSAALIMARDAFKAVGFVVTDAQIEKALADVDSVVKALQSNPIFQAVQQLQATKVVEPTPAPVQEPAKA